MSRANMDQDPLFSAVEYKLVSKVKILWPAAKAPNKQSQKGYSIFLLACENYDKAIFDLLLTRREDIDITLSTNKGYTALHILAFKGHDQALVQVVEAFPKVDIDAVSQVGHTPLIEACKTNNVAVVDYLLSKGADVNFNNNEKRYTALHYSACYGHVQCAELLLKHGADVDPVDGHCFTPLIKAASWGYTTLCDLLVRHGADINFVSQESCSTALISACKYNFLDVVKLLVSHGADIHYPGPYSEALFTCAKWGRFECAEVLTEAGVDVTARKMNGKTALDVARESRHGDVMRLLSM